ncbi:hypothetical protein [Haloarchaeobius sp. TZWSO28]|uniref:hypothetical protein n=1 Tax=Haloarchaeobius sp. TZWSO28 TaxID=3446119 RepID=UPI003EB8F20C
MQDGDRLVEMTESPYEYESILQTSLADFPRLLAGDQMGTDSRREWALVAREAAVPDKEGGNERWSADHLFVDQDAIPTIVEVKRSSDTRIRREIVGQMLDYVSHASIYWNAESLRDRFVQTCEERELVPERVLTELAGDEQSDDFWNRMEANLRSKHVRLLFVADEIPSELKRVVEFLNEAMPDVQVFAIEVKQYTGDGKQAFVPRLFGQTEEARGSSSASARPNHSADDFLEDVDAKYRDGDLSEGEAAAIRDLYEFVKEEADSYDFGGSSNVSVNARWTVIGGSEGMFTVNSSGKVSFWQPENTVENVDVAWSRAELREWYADLAAINHPAIDPIEGDTKFPTSALEDETNRDQFKQACRDFVGALSQSND